MLYEAALGLGIAIGPLLGGLLGEVSWRGPFFGVVALMAIAFLCVAVLLRGPRTARVRIPFSAPFRALGRPALAILAVAALSIIAAALPRLRRRMKVEPPLAGPGETD